MISEQSTGFPGYNSIIDRDKVTIGRMLKDNGYATAWFGKDATAAIVSPEAGLAALAAIEARLRAHYAHCRILLVEDEDGLRGLGGGLRRGVISLAQPLRRLAMPRIRMRQHPHQFFAARQQAGDLAHGPGAVVFAVAADLRGGLAQGVNHLLLRFRT